MATQEKAAQVLAQTKPQGDIVSLIKQSAKELGKALPQHMNPERMARIALTAVRLNPKLLECTPESFMGSLFVLAQIGLEPIAGRAYILPFRNNRKMIVDGKEEWRSRLEAQALIGYKGLAELFYRHESAATIDMQTVCQNDTFDYEYGTDAYLKHKPNMGDRGPAIGYYAIARMKGGDSKFHYMSKQQCIDHAKKHSKVYDKKKDTFMAGTPWTDDVDAMCMKTVLIQLAKLLPLSVEMQRAMSIDETSREYRTGITDALDLPDTTNWQDKPEEATIVPQDKPVEHQPKITKAASKTQCMPASTLQAISAVKERIGDAKFYQALGNMGYERLEDIPNIEEANKLIKELTN